MKTFSAKPHEVKHEWFVVDATDKVLGRLAAEVARRLRGKHKPTFTPHMDTGDNVIIINAEKVKLTGQNKAEQSIFYWHTGYPGGIKERSAKTILQGRYPERVIMKAVERMLPEGPMGRKLLTNLRVFAGTEHPHAPQNPEVIDMASLNPKNKRS